MHYDYESFFTNCSRCFDVIYMHVKLYSVPHKDTFFSSVMHLIPLAKLHEVPLIDRGILLSTADPEMISIIARIVRGRTGK